ncbi:uncharacterized protein PpBr36_06086 [Pyricularia pennisetigena]|uniref:uncharacterized protein n=1 Tax=Pyricularia pennisetigena TaxID=1578925 RepID=UPI001152420A|nr:uncharacterized protein PpBr36_06086 [Pyricularia pennisetigena]TLS23512.1 hypothetical protein PpBr36_06086 [Pyricularia pennisetigena]
MTRFTITLPLLASVVTALPFSFTFKCQPHTNGLGDRLSSTPVAVLEQPVTPIQIGSGSRAPPTPSPSLVSQAAHENGPPVHSSLGGGQPPANQVQPIQASPAPAPKTTKIKIPPGFTTTLFSDDFSDLAPGLPPSPSKWTIDTGNSYPGGPMNWGTNEIQTYTNSPSNLAITEAGTLRITPTGPSYGVDVGGRWASARIRTKPEHDFAPQAGKRTRIEARLLVGAGNAQAGIWPAFWSLGAAYRDNYQNWPSVGEVDIFETVNGLPSAWHTVHCGSSAVGGPCNESAGIGRSVPMSRGEFHTVAVEIDRTGGRHWSEETLQWSIDGAVTFTLAGARVGDERAWTSLAHSPRFLLLNVAVGGGFPDAVAKTRTPALSTIGGVDAALEVDYVAVFST